jgi:4-hydroxybenzoyl-CoA reductase subunit alpha
VFAPGSADETLSFEKAVALAEARNGPVSGSGSYTPPDLAGSYKGGGVGPSPAYSFGAYAAEVHVDEDTGQVSVIRLAAAHDLGVALNPPAAEGQIEGAVVMGLGETLWENHAFLDRGQHASPSLLEYKVPTALDVPHIEALLVESIDPEGPYGAKEVGEGSLHPSNPAVVNAVYDAVGVWLHQVPITPEAVLAALRKKANP